MLQSFGNDAGFILEISVINNGRMDSGSGPGQTSTARVLSEIQFTD